MKSWMTPIGGTKFVLALLSSVGSFALCLTSHIDGGVYLATTVAIVGGYITGDVIQRKNESAAP